MSGGSAGEHERPVRAMRRRIAALEEEVASLRSALRAAGIEVAPSVSATTPPVVPPVADASDAAPIVVRHKPERPKTDDLPLTSYLRERRDECPPRFEEPAADVRETESVAPPPPLPPVVFAPPPHREPRPSRVSFEQFLGAKLAAWVGAIAVLAAVGFFLKFAYDQGWLGRLTATTRLAASYAFAAALLVVGEVALRRFGRAAAVGLFAAGVGSLYLATLAGSWPLGVFSVSAALAMATGVAIVGALLTWHSRMLSVGVVSVVGGELALLVLGAIDQPGLLPPTHLTILLGIGLALASVAPSPFLALRFVSVIATIVVGAVWFAVVGHTSQPLAVTLAAAWWSMTTFEAIVAALRGRSPRANAASMLLMTFTVASVGSVDALGPGPWTSAFSYVPIALALLSAGLALQFGGGLDALRPLTNLEPGEATTDDERRLLGAARTLGIALWAQAGILFVAGIGIFLRHGALTAAWVATGVGALELARRLRSKPTAAFGFVVLILGAFAGIVSSLLRTVGTVRPPLGNGWWLHLPPGWTGGAVAVTALAFVAWRWSRRSATAGDEATLVAGSPAPSLADANDLAARLVFIAPLCGLLFEVMWIGGSFLRAGPCLALALMLAPSLYFALAFRHDLLRWPRWYAVASLFFVISLWMFFRLPTVFGGTGVVALLAPPLGAVGSMWLLAARQLERRAQERLLVTSIVLLAIVATFEIFADLVDPSGAASPRLRCDVATVVLTAIGVVTLLIGRAGQWKLVHATGAQIIVFGSFIWCMFATVLPRMSGVFDEPLFANATVGSGVVAFVGCAIAYSRRGAYVDSDRPALASVPPALAVFLVLIPIWIVSLVIDAALDPSRGFVDDGTPRQAALSAWWGIAALALIAIGFARRAAALRYAGLAGLALVAAKVLLVDMQGAGTIWRVVGMLAAGLLMVATSVVYVRVGRFFDGVDDAGAPPRD
ncbi:MAG: DUF2339 domain-containing protein [Phycisphaerales bacterium]